MRIANQLIVGLFSELTAPGGIQQVSRHAGAVLAEQARPTGRICELVGLNDRRGEGTFVVGEGRYSFQGFERRKAALAAHVVQLAPRAQLLLAGHVNLGPVAMAAAARNPGLKYWVIAHGIEVWQPLPVVRRSALRRASGVLAVSKHTAEAVEREQGVAREKIKILPLAIDPSYDGAASPPELSLPTGSRILLTVARLSAAEPGKGIDTVIRAMPRLTAAFPELRYVVVGDGDARPSLEKLAEECGVSDRVVFAGLRKVGSLRAFYEAADIFVMPSQQEGFGIVFLEAMAAGKPAVAANCGGAPEVVADGQTGFLVEYGDVEGLTARLGQLLADDELRGRMGESARRIVESRHRFEHFRECLTACLASGANEEE